MALDWIAQNYASAHVYNLPIVAYEGGQSFLGLQPIQHRFAEFIYEQPIAILVWESPTPPTSTVGRALGGTLFNHFTDIGTWSKWGYWGTLENVLQTSSPKYDALLSFISNNPCWWTGCGNASSTPKHPFPPLATSRSDGLAGSAGSEFKLILLGRHLGLLAIISSAMAVKSVSLPAPRTGSALSPGTTYTYAVSAYNAVGDSAQSSPTSVATLTAAGHIIAAAAGHIIAAAAGHIIAAAAGHIIAAAAGHIIAAAVTSSPPPVPPTVAIVSPPNGTLYNGNNPVNIAVAGNGINGIASIAIMVDGAPLVTCSNTTSCSTSWQGKKIPQGIHTVSATAVDALGYSAKGSITFTKLK